MRILVVGAGAVGGYFGGRLLEAGRDVTFLVRSRRASELAAHGLTIKSPLGDASMSRPPTILAENLRTAFDLIVLSCKAYDLDGAIASFAPAVGAQTAILPLLNGMRHIDALVERFGPERVLGGQCVIASTLGDSGAIRHLNQSHDLSFGERDGVMSDRVRAIAEAMASAKFNARASTQIILEMWEKWAFLASLAACTCLMRAAVGDVAQSPRGTEFTLALFGECVAIAKANGQVPRDAYLERSRAALTAAGSDFTASMLRDIENRGPIEADHILGDLIRRGRREASGVGPIPLLEIAHLHLKAYEARRARLK